MRNCGMSDIGCRMADGCAASVTIACHPLSAIRHPPSARGFTLIECLLAGLVLAIFGAAMATTVAQAMAANEKAAKQRQAAMYLDEVLTRIDTIGPATVAQQGPTEGEIGGFTWTADITQNAASDLYVVNVSIQWSTARGFQSIDGHTLMHDPIGSRPVLLYWEDLDG